MKQNQGNTSVEYIMVISVLVAACISAGLLYVPGFKDGVRALGEDVRALLSGDAPGNSTGSGGDSGGGGVDTGGGGYGGGGGQGGSGGPSGGGGTGGGGYGGGGGPGGGGADGGGGGAGDGGGDDAPPEEPPEEPPEDEDDEDACPYVYDDASGQWRDPVTGQYVSGDNATSAGC